MATPLSGDRSMPHELKAVVDMCVFFLLMSFADALQLAWLAMTQPPAVAAADGRGNLSIPHHLI